MNVIDLTWARLTIRLSRFELLAFGGIILGFAAISVIGAAQLDSLRPPANCLVFNDTGASAVGCEGAMNAWSAAQNGVIGLAVGLTVFLTFAAGLFLGVPIVARELERGTSRLAWSMAPSRMRWYVQRLLPILVLLAIVSFIGGVAVDRYIASTVADTDLSKSFTAFGFRGLLVASRAVFIFATAVLVGSIVGRALPAVIFAAIIATIGLAGGERVHQMILATEAVAIPVDPQTGNDGNPGDLYIDQRFMLPDGTLVGYEYFGFEGNGPYDENGNPKYPMFILAIPGERYRFVETREAAALAAGSLAALILAGFVVSRRRPG